MTKQTTRFLVTSMGKQARVVSFSSLSPNNTNLMVVFCSYLRYLFHPLTCLSLMRISHRAWEGQSTGSSGLHVGLCTEICLQMYHHVLLLLSQPGLSNAVPLVDAGPLYPHKGMQMETLNNCCGN